MTKALLHALENQQPSVDISRVHMVSAEIRISDALRRRPDLTPSARAQIGQVRDLLKIKSEPKRKAAQKFTTMPDPGPLTEHDIGPTLPSPDPAQRGSTMRSPGASKHPTRVGLRRST
jgi:hypothetical protein